MALRPNLVAGALEGPIALNPRYLVRATTMLQAADAAARQVPAAWSDDGDGWEETGLYGRPGDRGYDLVQGLAVIPIEGVLISQLGCLRPLWGFVTGYDGIRASLANALQDAAVERIALRIDSPGGMVNGCFDLVDEIAAATGLKPIAATLAENAYSAAYALACATDFISVPRTGGVGSIGVIQPRVDISQMLEREGVQVTFTVSEGAERKADGHPEKANTPEEQAATQVEIDYLGGLFYDTVAKYRGLDPAAVRGLKAACFLGPAGLEVGLADHVAAPAEALRAFAGL